MFQLFIKNAILYQQSYLEKQNWILNIRVNSAKAVIMLGGIVCKMKGPKTNVGIIVMRSMLFFSANSQPTFSTNVLDTKYIQPVIFTHLQMSTLV